MKCAELCLDIATVMKSVATGQTVWSYVGKDTRVTCDSSTSVNGGVKVYILMFRSLHSFEISKICSSCTPVRRASEKTNRVAKSRRLEAYHKESYAQSLCNLFKVQSQRRVCQTSESRRKHQDKLVHFECEEC